MNIVVAVWDALYLAWQYLRFQWPRTLVLVGSLTLMLFLPLAIQTLVQQAAASLRARAASTPLVVGGQGSETDLILNSLYFDAGEPVPTKYAECTRVNRSKLARAIPLFVRFRAEGDTPIVGTSLDYLDFRKLRVANGRPFALLGECVVGASVARRLNLLPGDTLLSQRENAFELVGLPPLKMHVVGVLAATGSPDDDVVFVDVKTTWVIAGLGHGHNELADPSAEPMEAEPMEAEPHRKTRADSDSRRGQVLRRDGNQLTASAAVELATEITPENIDSFHFHGATEDFPLSAVIALPRDTKSATLLQGRYLRDDEPARIVAPATVVDRLLATVFRVRDYLLFGAAVMSVSLLLLAGLVITLTYQLRAAEFATYARIGGSRLHIWLLVAWENTLLIAAALLSTTVLTLLTQPFGQLLLQPLLR